jgi:hypothetical protein
MDLFAMHRSFASLKMTALLMTICLSTYAVIPYRNST